MMLPEINIDYIDPIGINQYEHVSVVLPDGRVVCVYHDAIRIQTAADYIRKKDGFKIWDAKTGPRESKQYPYGQTHLTERV